MPGQPREAQASSVWRSGGPCRLRVECIGSGVGIAIGTEVFEYGYGYRHGERGENQNRQGHIALNEDMNGDRKGG